jgi:hypothetical protein
MRFRPRRSSRVWVLGLVTSACVGAAPSPPADSPSTTTGTSRGDETTASPTTAESSSAVDADTAEATAGTTLEIAPDTSTGDAPGTSSSGTSTGEPPGSSSSTASESSSGEPPPPPSCQELFGTADGYTLCAEDGASCTFALNSNGASCNVICNSFGHACIGAIDNPGGLECVSQGMLSCDDLEGGTTICICAK